MNPLMGNPEIILDASSLCRSARIRVHFCLINIALGGLIGIASGLSIKKLLKYSTLGLIGNAFLGVIGFVLGFYGCLFFVSSNLLVSFIAAVASASILILLAEILRHPSRK
jgi:uncharacterized membrane protein YeaQ/YmgE (transglycosylase-associated protein family)